MKSKSILGGVVAAALFASSTFAADVASTPLPAGKPAGTKQAALGIATLPFLLIAGSLTLAIIAGAGGFNSSTVATSGTTS